MPRRARMNRSLALGWLLVAIQGLLLVAVVAWPTSWGPSLPAAREAGGALFALGGVGACGAAVYLGRALTPIPQPNGAGLRARGVYRWMRHPMYTSLVVLCIGLAMGRGSLAVWLFVGGLAVFVEVKTRVEERYLLAAYDGYADYAARTGKFIPGVGRRPVRA